MLREAQVKSVGSALGGDSCLQSVLKDCLLPAEIFNFCCPNDKISEQDFTEGLR